MSTDNVNVEITGSVAGLVAAMHEGATVVREGTEAISTSFEAMAAAVEAALGPLLLITAVLEGGEMFKEAIEKTADLAVQLEVLSQKTGETAEEISRLRYAADLSHVSFEELSTGLQRLARGMEQTEKGTGPAADAFRALGIHVTDASGHLRPMSDVMDDVADRFTNMKDGAGKTALAMDLFGRSGANLIPLLNQGKQGIGDLKETADRLGITMSGPQVSAAVAYEEAMKNLHGAMDGVERQLVTALMPALSSIASALSESIPSAGEAFRVIGEVIGGTLRVIASVAMAAWGALKELYYVLMAVNDVAHGNLVGAAADIEAMGKAADDTVASIKRIWSTVDEKPKPTAGGADAPIVTAKGARLKVWRDEWDAIVALNKDQFDYARTHEEEFWRSKISQTVRDSDEYIAVWKNIAKAEEATAKDAFESKMQGLQAQEALDRDDHTRVLADRRAELAEIRKHYADTSKEVQEGQRKVNEAQRVIVDDTAKEWKALANHITSSFTEAFGQIGKTVFSMRDLFRETFRDIAKMSAETGLASLRDHLATELAKKNITASGAAERVGVYVWEHAQQLALWAQERVVLAAKFAWEETETLRSVAASVAAVVAGSLSKIASYAAEAAAAAWAAISAIPLAGPFLAPAAAAAALAGVLALAGNVKSAAGGYDVPAGTNPMTQLHAQEMVLPADLANRVRGMTGDGGGDTHIHIHTMDARGVKQFVLDNHREFAAGVKLSIKNGTLTSKDLGRG